MDMPAAFVFDRVKLLVAKMPAWADKESFHSFLTGNPDAAKGPHRE